MTDRLENVWNVKIEAKTTPARKERKVLARAGDDVKGSY